jgi:hypothetical protein
MDLILVLTIGVKAPMPEGPEGDPPPPSTVGRDGHRRNAFRANRTLEASPEAQEWFCCPRGGSQEGTDANLTTNCQILVTFRSEVDAVTRSNALQVSDSSFCICGCGTSGRAAGVQNLKVCDACGDQVFYQIIP